MKSYLYALSCNLLLLTTYIFCANTFIGSDLVYDLAMGRHQRSEPTVYILSPEEFKWVTEGQFSKKRVEPLICDTQQSKPVIHLNADEQRLLQESTSQLSPEDLALLIASAHSPKERKPLDVGTPESYEGEVIFAAD